MGERIRKIGNIALGDSDCDIEQNKGVSLKSGRKILKKILKNSIRFLMRILRRLKTEIALNFPCKVEENLDTVIVSLTSRVGRLETLPIVIKSLLRQRFRPHKIILYLDSDTKNTDIPKKLLRMQNDFFEIRTGYENLKPHTKYFYAMQEFPEHFILTVDDDSIYDKNLIKNLYETHKKYPDCIVARRCHLMTKQENGFLNNYRDWKFECTDIKTPSDSLVATGEAGILYPPHSLPKETFNPQTIKKYCLTTDDIWLKFMELKAGKKIVFTDSLVIHPLTVRSTQFSCLMTENNKVNGKNDEAIASLEKITGIRLRDFAVTRSSKG